nr:MAG TPA: hypothetical protein [Ackermannviridae sp.]
MSLILIVNIKSRQIEHSQLVSIYLYILYILNS